MLLGSEGCLESVRVVREESQVNGFHGLAVVLREAHVLLLIDGLKLCVESSDHRVHEPVGLDLRPVVDLVGRNVLLIDRHIIGSEGVGVVGADDGHQFVIFIRNGDLGRLVADRVYLMVDRLALLRVGLCAVNLEEGLDGVEHRLLGGVVGGSEALRALEHQVLKVVGESCRLLRIILAADLDRDVGLHARSLLVDGHINLQPVVKGVDLCV